MLIWYHFRDKLLLGSAEALQLQMVDWVAGRLVGYKLLFFSSANISRSTIVWSWNFAYVWYEAEAQFCPFYFLTWIFQSLTAADQSCAEDLSDEGTLLGMEAVMWCLEALPRLEAASRRIFTASASVSTPDVLALASVSTNLPRSCYCLEAPIPEKPILLLQLIAFIKVTRKYEQNRRKIPLELCRKKGYEPKLHYM